MKKFLTFILVLAMVLSVSSVAMAEGEVAQFGETKYAKLQDAIDAAESAGGGTVTLLTDVEEDVTVEQAPNVVITINGNDKIMKGTITVDGKSKRYDTAGVTIKNFNFDAATISKDACIRLGDGTNETTKKATRYTSNVTVENCTFTDSGATVNDKAAIKQYTGGCHNLKIIGCKATKMHSLMQLYNVEVGLVIDDCKITDSKGGISINFPQDVTIKDTVINVIGYGIRIGTSGTSYDISVTVEDTDVTAKQPIVVRYMDDANDKAAIDISDTENTFTPTEGGNPIETTSGDDGTTATTNPPTGGMTQTGEVAAQNGNTYYTSVQEAINAAEKNDSDKTVKLLANSDETVDVPDGVNLDKNGYEVKVDVPNTNTPSNDPTTTTKPSGNGISVKYNGGNSFSTSNPAVPTGVEIDGVPVTFNGTGSNFSVGCISSDAKWVTVRWNSTTVTTNFTPDGLVECTTVSIPKTGDMSFWAAVAAFFGF